MATLACLVAYLAPCHAVRDEPSIFLPCLAGAALGLVCAILSVLVGGAGHGWTSAWPFGLLSLVLFPVALARLRRFRSVSLAASAALLMAGVGLDVVLYHATLSEGVGYFLRVQSLAIVWLALWCTWQVAALATVVLAALRNRMHIDSIPGVAES